MKITSFHPIILSSKANDIVMLFEDLGFESRHFNNEYENRDSTQMKDPSGFRVDVAQIDSLEQDQILLRLNVDDFDEAHELLRSHGFTDKIDQPVESPSSKAISMVSPSGFRIGLIHHKKEV